MPLLNMLDWLRVSRALDGVNRDRRRLILPREPQVERSRYGRGPGLHTVVMPSAPPVRGDGGADMQLRVHAC